jgi:hypothetical protein
VPAEQHDFYSESIRINVQIACEREGLAQKGLTIKQGTTLLRSAVGLYEALGNISDDERQLIKSILVGKSEFIFDRISRGGVDGLRQTTYQLTLLFSLLTGKPHPRYPHQAQLPRKRGKSPGGRRPGSIKRSIFQDFVFDLWLSTRVAGGRLSFERNTPQGTMTQALKALAPHLPEGFVPKALPAPTLQKLKNLCSRAEVAVDELDCMTEEVSGLASAKFTTKKTAR